jgi:hypothetical protein
MNNQDSEEEGSDAEEGAKKFKNSDLRQQREGKEELDIKFNIGFGEDIGKNILK